MLKFNRPTLVTITAPTASGKNYLRDAIEEKFGWDRIVSTTTRAKRSGEVQGQDYHFISRPESIRLEEQNKFAELISFRGTRYGVTRIEMESKMSKTLPSMVILEPQGLELYKYMCSVNGWDIFSIYIHAAESIRTDRLIKRTAADIAAGGDVKKLLDIHTDRLLSITGDERRWINASNWDLIADGTDGERSLDDLEIAVKYRNDRNKQPTAYTHTL